MYDYIDVFPIFYKEEYSCSLYGSHDEWEDDQEQVKMTSTCYPWVDDLSWYLLVKTLDPYVEYSEYTYYGDWDWLSEVELPATWRMLTIRIIHIPEKVSQQDVCGFYQCEDCIKYNQLLHDASHVLLI